ncbi:MAG: hypothetical protein KKD39_03695 [Candidatus Altiarchaeota archaeon]|nr:hypothetical protein [Candidatus Altiarchaeota archaeon]
MSVAVKSGVRASRDWGSSPELGTLKELGDSAAKKALLASIFGRLLTTPGGGVMNSSDVFISRLAVSLEGSIGRDSTLASNQLLKPSGILWVDKLAAVAFLNDKSIENRGRASKIAEGLDAGSSIFSSLSRRDKLDVAAFLNRLSQEQVDRFARLTKDAENPDIVPARYIDRYLKGRI